MASKCLQYLSLFVVTSVCAAELTPQNISTSGFGYELVQERLDQLQFSFLELFVHVKELGETVLNNQRSLEGNQQQVNQLMHHHQKQLTDRVDDLQVGVSANVSLVADYSKQILNLQTICANHDKIRQELERFRPNSTHALKVDFSNPESKDDTKKANIKSCKSANSKSSGIFNLLLTDDSPPIPVFCELQRFGGGWLVIQQRFDGSVNFYRGWSDYRDGFGVIGEEFWLGLEAIHQITKRGTYELMVELEDFSGNYKYARYTEFQLGVEAEKYALNKLGSYSGTADDSLAYHKGMKFSTFDSDNDPHSSNCAKQYKGAWWYQACHFSNLNGEHLNQKSSATINWQKSTSWTEAGLKYTRMMIREK
ncbi:hypothetical protein quinque_011287 [Culex quinquefasciatus]